MHSTQGYIVKFPPTVIVRLSVSIAAKIDKASNRQILEKKTSKSSRAFMEIVKKFSQKMNT